MRAHDLVLSFVVQGRRSISDLVLIFSRLSPLFDQPDDNSDALACKEGVEKRTDLVHFQYITIETSSGDRARA